METASSGRPAEAHDPSISAGAAARGPISAIRRIFAAGLDLQAALELIGEHRAASKIWHAIGELDHAVRDIREAIFDCDRATHGPDPTAHGVDLPICTAALTHRFGTFGPGWSRAARPA